MTPSARRAARLVRLALALLSVVGLALAVFYLLMRPARTDLGLMALVLTSTSALGLLGVFLAYRFGWIHRAPSIRWALLAAYLISSLLIFFSVWITARLMFVSEHDLLLASILLLFASGIAVAMGSFFSAALAERIHNLNQAIEQVRQREFAARAEVGGQDEIAELAATFNEMAEQLQLAEQRRSAAERSRRELIAWVGHDLQTPLASIRAMVEALADDMVEDQETARRYLRTAQREVQSLSALIDDLFELTQLDAGGIQLDLGENSMADLVSDTLEAFSAVAAEKQIQLTGKVVAGVDPVVMDARRVGRVLSNLVGNAIRYTSPGGWVHIAAELAEDLVRVEVRDSGEGFDEQDLPHIFDRFYRGEKSRSRATGGAGLGLAIARGFIEAHGGEIRAEAGNGIGARLVFALPKAARAAKGPLSELLTGGQSGGAGSER